MIPATACPLGRGEPWRPFPASRCAGAYDRELGSSIARPRGKVLGVGLNKTGTTTLGACLSHWGFRHVGWDGEAFELWRNGRTDELLARVEQYDSLEDFPWLLLHEEIDAAFPGSKFILTTRISAKTWFRSVCAHADKTGPHPVNLSVYGHAMPRGHGRRHIQIYEDHNRKLREYFRGRPDDFLDACWEQGDGWRELGEFLGLKAPDLPFPHANKSPTGIERIKRRIRGWV